MVCGTMYPMLRFRVAHSQQDNLLQVAGTRTRDLLHAVEQKHVTYCMWNNSTWLTAFNGTRTRDLLHVEQQTRDLLHLMEPEHVTKCM